MFHIDLLTLYWETITHGANYLRPPPDLIDNEEEYEIEKILDSRQFSRHKQLQYLVKWKGYPDLDNMWVDKDDIFADDKVWEFKDSHPDARTHIRQLWKDRIPQFTLSPSRPPSSSSYFKPRTLSMSDVGTPDHRSTPGVPGTRVPSPTASKVAEAFRLMSLGPPPESSSNMLRPKTDATASIVFRSPIPESMGMRTVQEWHWERLLQYHLQWEERHQQRIKQGLTPTTLTTSRICDLAQEAVVPLNIATDIPPRHRRHHPYLSDLDPYSPDAWSTLTSTIWKRQDWLINCPLLSKKMTKIPLHFCQPTLPKGWVYEEDIKVEELTLPPTSGLSTSHNLTMSVSRAHHRRHPWDLNITRGLPLSPSTSPTARDERSLHGTSKSTWQLTTPTS